MCCFIYLIELLFDDLIEAAIKVMWEVLSRTSLGDGDDEVAPYKQPFEDVTSTYPSLGEMRDVVVNRKLRPEFRPAITQHPVSCPAVPDAICM